ncbi:YraN family protein [Caproiciproducens sp. NJN-50]|uniref:YraN family protein n=2 Tax=Acutalibacteraceae TaxID=3082771 RepID=UPI000FFE2845|nr:YraN family protein [Caproiciproducens sp. NJN-50]QAT49601.1 YraN family protein [Caproiciproducens sp. NJN-50]
MNNGLGPLGETYAAEYLRKQGFQILERNYRSRFGEIDIIAENGQYIVFAEVKTRRASSLAEPEEAVTPGKQKKIAKTALLYLQKHPTRLQPRFDVIGIVAAGTGSAVQSLRHVKDAFSYPSYY